MCSPFRSIIESQYTPPPRGVYARNVQFGDGCKLRMWPNRAYGKRRLSFCRSVLQRRNANAGYKPVGLMCNLHPSPNCTSAARILACGGICSTCSRQCRWRTRSTARTGPRTTCAYRPHSADGLASAPMSGAAAAACRAEMDHFDFHHRHRIRYDSFRGPCSVFRRPRPFRGGSLRRRRHGLHRPDSGSGRLDSACPRRRGCSRRRSDGHG